MPIPTAFDTPLGALGGRVWIKVGTGHCHSPLPDRLVWPFSGGVLDHPVDLRQHPAFLSWAGRWSGEETNKYILFLFIPPTGRYCKSPTYYLVFVTGSFGKDVILHTFCKV